MLLLTESLITFKGEFVIFAAKLKDDSLLLKEILLSHNGEFVSIKGWKNNGGNVVFNGRIVIEPGTGWPIANIDIDTFTFQKVQLIKVDS